MNLKFDNKVLEKYTSSSQIARVLTEGWVKRNTYCPSCGHEELDQFSNNSPVADFLCPSCKSEYELKSKKNTFSLRIVDGAYSSMIDRINANNNPHFFFLTYSAQNLEVSNFIVIPKHYFIDDIIEKRKPLSPSARRAGWIGCNILLQNIPSSGKIYLVKDGKFQDKKLVLDTWAQTSFLASQKKESRGWIIEILNVLEKIPQKDFSLGEVYKFESLLRARFPSNNFIKDKIRQQLQVLRDRDIIEFTGRGKYKKKY
jgi:type II restriction enzyme